MPQGVLQWYTKGTLGSTQAGALVVLGGILRGASCGVGPRALGGYSKEYSASTPGAQVVVGTGGQSLGSLGYLGGTLGVLG